MSDALVFRDVVKRYGRRRPPALDGLSFRVPRGVICGFVGPNGAGKTTAFSVCSGFLAPDAGEVSLLGEGPFDPWRFKGRVGVLPQDAELPDRHTPVELLTHLAALQGLFRGEAKREALRWVEAVRLGDRAGDRIGALSHGMRRRVAVASALLGTPELVLLDEPTAGLDPVQARSLRTLLQELRGPQTLVVSSHNLLELEQVCDWVVMIDKGRCLREGSVAEVTGHGERLVWDVGPGRVDLAQVEALVAGARVARDGETLVVEVPVGADLDGVSLDVMAALVAQRVPLRGLRRGMSLEDRFVGDAGEDR